MEEEKDPLFDEKMPLRRKIALIICIILAFLGLAFNFHWMVIP